MGTEISLDVGGLTIDWCKNSRGTDHGALFQDKDLKHHLSDQINYEYFEENNEDPGLMERAFVRRLKETIPRIEMLGFTIDAVQREYEASVEAWIEERESIEEEGTQSSNKPMSFEQFRRFVMEHPVASIDDTFVSGLDEASTRRIQGRFNDETLTNQLPHYYAYDIHAYSERSYFGGLIGFLHPYSILQLLAQNDQNLELDVVWQFGPLVDAGWASESEFVSGARRTQKILVATEGSSDAHILKHAFTILRPDVADFFQFIDMSGGHPFPGAGNLVKFAKGLIKIDVQNSLIFLFDNDAEGVYAFQQLERLDMPSNMRAIMLPCLKEFEAFYTRGPEGDFTANINGRAAAIECYLDLNLEGYPPASVLWTNYKKDLGIYHGSLEYKETYTKEFLKQTSDTISMNKYRVDKLMIVLSSLIDASHEIV